MSTSLTESGWTACLSALRLDRWILRELSPADAQSVQEHLAGCDRCRAAAAELEQQRAQTVLPPLRALQQQPRRPRWARRALAAGAGLLAAAAAIALWPQPQGERLKGSGLSLHMFVQHDGQVRRAGPGEAVAPGDAVRFAVTTPQRAYVAVLSVDPRGRASIYFPLGPRAEAVSAGAEVALPLGTRLDEVPGTERLFALFCAAPVELAPVRAALQAAAAPPTLEGCQVITWSFVKR